MASQVEILIKARNEANAAFQQLIKSLEGTRQEAAKTNQFLSGMADSIKGSLNPALLSMNAAGLAAGAALAVAGKAAIDAVTQFAAFGGQLTDQAAKLGVSTTALQLWAVQGKQVGVATEQIAGAVLQMERRLVTAPASFEKLGLSAQKLIAMRPEDAFEEVGRAIAKIPEPAKQTAAAIEMFGRAGAQVLPLLKTDMEDVANRARELGQILSAETVAAADKLDDEITMLSATWEGLQNNLIATVATNPDLVATLTDLTDVLGSVSKMVQDNQDAIGGWIARLVQLNNTVVPLIPLLKEWSRLQDDLSPALKTGGISFEPPTIGGMGPEAALKLLGEQINETEKLIKANDKASASAAKHAEALRAQWQSASEKARAEWDKFYDNMRSRSGDMVAEQQKAIDAMAKENEKAGLLIIEGLKRQNEEQARIAQENHEAWMNLADTIFMVGDAIGGTMGDFLKLGASAIVVSENWNVKLTTTAQKVTAVAGALQGAFNAFNSGSFLGGAGAGAAAGSMFGPIGAGIGALAGGLLGLFGGASKARKEMEALRNEFVKNQGGMQALSQKAREAGISLTAMFNAKSATALKAAIAGIQDQLAVWQDAQDGVKEAAERYGLTIDELGPKFAQQELDKMALQLIKDYELLKASGADMTAVISKMGPEFNKYVNEVIKAGGTIPSSMKPIIDQLIAEGKLVDENGNAYKSAEEAGIKYGVSQSEMFEQQLDYIRRMVEAIERLAGIKVAPIKVPIEPEYAPGFPGEHGSGGYPKGPGGSPPEFAMGGFTGPGYGPIPAILHPNEFVHTMPQMQELLGNAASMGAAQAMAMMQHSGGGSNGPAAVYLGNEFMGNTGRVLSRMSRDGRFRVHPHGIQRGAGGF